MLESKAQPHGKWPWCSRKAGCAPGVSRFLFRRWKRSTNTARKPWCSIRDLAAVRGNGLGIGGHAVVEGGKLLGLLTMENIGELVMANRPSPNERNGTVERTDL